MKTESARIHLPQRRVNRTVLDNGTTLLYSPNANNHIVAIRVLSKLGSKHEPEDRAGQANLTMRMLSAGTKLHSEEQIALLLERNGAHYNAEAGKDSNAIDLLTTTHFLEEDLQTVLELINSPTFPSGKLERERDIVRMSIKEQEDSLLNFTVRIFRKHFYGSHPYSWANIGLPESLDSIQQSHLQHFASASFDPSQMIVSVVGGSDLLQTESRIKSVFSERTGRTAEIPPSPENASLAIAEDTDVSVKRGSESEYLILGYPAPGVTSNDAVVFRMISSILGGSMDSRLFREIRDKRGLCYQIGTSYSPHHDLSPFMIYIVLTPQNREVAIRCAEAEMERLKTEPVSEEELERVKTYVCGTYMMALETNMGQAARFASYENAGLGWEMANTFPREVTAITQEQIMEAARLYFTKRLLTVTSPLG